MKRRILTSVAVLTVSLLVSVIAGCGAKLPTTTEDTQGDPHQQKLQTHTEVIQDNDAAVNVE